jgi:FixJ family two-component response regulator
LLSQRQREVFALLARGLSNKMIAAGAQYHRGHCQESRRHHIRRAQCPQSRFRGGRGAQADGRLR